MHPRLLPYLLLAPAVLLVAGITLYPALYAGFLSLTDYTLLTPGDPVLSGFSHYVAMWSDELFLGAIWRTVRWTVAVVGLQILIAVPIALLLNLRFRGRAVLRSIVLIPYVIPAAVVAIIWVFLFDSNFGVVNEMLTGLGVTERNIAFLSSSSWSFWILVLALVWQATPLMVIVLLAALQSLRREIVEAAEIDGAGRWQKFIHVILPHLMPTIWLLMLLRTMWMAHHVEVIVLLTGGGPGTANYTLPVYSFGLTTKDFDIAYASAIAVALSLMLLVGAVFYLRQLERSKEYL